MGLIFPAAGKRLPSLLKDEAPMDDTSLAVYGLRADRLNAIGHAADPPPQLSDAAVMTTGWVARWFVRGNFEAAHALLCMPRYVPHRLRRSRLNRRLQRLTDLVWRRFDR